MYDSMRIFYEPLRSLGFADIGANYVNIGDPFSHPVRILRVFNNTDVDLLISFDGETPEDFIATKSGYVYDYSTNRSDQAGLAEQVAGTSIYVKENGTSAASGSIYVTVIYVD